MAIFEDAASCIAFRQWAKPPGFGQRLAIGVRRRASRRDLGEAASKVAPETRWELSNIPWRAIIGMRNRHTHAYFEINSNVLWKTATEEAPRLIPLLRAALVGDGAAGQ
jgi:hypothetical protein